MAELMPDELNSNIIGLTVECLPSVKAEPLQCSHVMNEQNLF